MDVLAKVREFFVYSITADLWWVPAIAAAAALFVTVSRFVGWRNALYLTGTFLGACIVVLANLKGRQAGWADRASKENRDADAMVKRADRARARAPRVGDRSLFDDDGFKRK